MKKAMLAFAALNMVLFAQMSRAEAPADPNASIMMVNAETNEVIRVTQEGVVTPVSDQEVQAMDQQLNNADTATVQPAALIGGGVNIGGFGIGAGIGRCGVGAHVGPIGVGANGCHGFWGRGHWHHGYWHHHHGRWHGHWARLY